MSCKGLKGDALKKCLKKNTNFQSKIDNGTEKYQKSDTHPNLKNVPAYDSINIKNVAIDKLLKNKKINKNG